MKIDKHNKFFVFYVDKVLIYILAALLIGLVLGCTYGVKTTYTESPEVIYPLIETTPTPTPTTPAQKPKISLKSWAGVASWYGTGPNECGGCKKYYDENGLYYLMSNGQRLDDGKKTIAFNRAPLGSKVKILNLDNNFITEAVVTDTGGFEKLGKIADLSVATRNALNTKGNPRVKITLLDK